MVTVVTVAEVVSVYEGIVVVAEAEAEADAHARSMVGESHTY